MVGKKSNIFSRLWKWIKGIFSDKKEVKISNKGGKNINSPQIAGDKNTVNKYTTINNDNRIFNNTYHNYPTSDKVSNPIVKDQEREQRQELKIEEETTKQDQTESKRRSEKDEEMPQQEFERLLMKVKFITLGIMGNIKWDKIKPLEFQKNEKGEQFAQLAFEIEKKRCYIVYKISEKDKQKFLKTSTFEIVERFITLRLVNCGRNDYYDYHCPDCKQTTLTKSLIKDSSDHEEAICCNLCGWAMLMEVYQEYLEDKKHNSSLEFYEWLRERNRRMAKTRREKD